MPMRGFGASVPSISGIEELISINVTGEVDQVQVDPGTANTAVTVVSYYNPRYNISVQGLYGGTTPGATFNFASLTFKTLSANVSETSGDVKKIDITGVYYPDAV